MPNDERTLADLGLHHQSEFWWPITCRFRLNTPWGNTQQELSLDVGDLRNKPEETLALVRSLWSVAIAPAISADVLLLFTEVVQWNGLDIPFPVSGEARRGQRGGVASARDSSPQLVLMPDNGRERARRRLFLAGAPSSWSSGGLLTPHGWELILTWARGAFIGLKPFGPQPAANWLIAYPRVVTPTPDNRYGVGFSIVESVRVCEHVDRAPDQSVLGWP